MNGFNCFIKWSWTFLVVVSLGLAGCDGDERGQTHPEGDAVEAPPGPLHETDRVVGQTRQLR